MILKVLDKTIYVNKSLSLMSINIDCKEIMTLQSVT